MSMIGNIKDLETKQKIMLVAIVVLVGFIIYFGYTTFFPTSNNVVVAPTVAPVKTTATPRSQTAAQSQVGVTPPVTTASETNTETSQLQKVGAPTTSAPTPEQLALLAESQQLQTEYLHLVNQYQVAQLQQKLAKTDAQIAAQKLAAAKSYLATQKLTGGSSEMPTSIFSSSSNKATIAPMQVMYVGQQAGVWSAMLGRSGNYYQVKVGTQLPDGSVVQSISNQGVILNKSGANQYLVIPKTLDNTSAN